MAIQKFLRTAQCSRIDVQRFLASGAAARKLTDEDIIKRREMMAKGLPLRKSIKDVKHVLVVASGKGGVGKSTTSVNLATAMKVVDPEKKVGLLDADIFGPTIPLMMNLHQTPLLNDEDLMEPLENYGVKCMSMGFLVDKKAPVIWRGLMVMSALNRLIRQVSWGPLDYLIVDTPPGTGDTLLSLVQNVPISGVLIVTTPQKAAVDVTRRGAQMFRKMKIPIVGIVENMTSTSCPKCNEDVPLFGPGSQPLATELYIDILQKFPLHEDITESGDSGKPIVLRKPESIQTNLYKNLAKDVIKFLDKQPVVIIK